MTSGASGEEWLELLPEVLEGVVLVAQGAVPDPGRVCLLLDLPARRGLVPTVQSLTSRLAQRRRGHYSLTRLLVRPEAELLFPAPSACMQLDFPEQIPGAYVVNGDGRHALSQYPPAQQQAQLELRLGQLAQLSLPPLTICGGIDAALQAICTCFSLQQCRALLLGRCYLGAERVLLLNGIRSTVFQDSQALLEEVSHDVQLVLVTHPSLYLCEDRTVELKRLADELPSGLILVVDECYVDYLPTALRSEELRRRGPAVLGVRSLSKLPGLASLRVAYVVASRSVTARLRASQPLKPMPTVVVGQALACLADFDAGAELALARRMRLRLQQPLLRRRVPCWGQGPYVVVAPRDAAEWARVVRSLARDKIFVAQSSPWIVYQPTGDDWDSRFLAVITNELSREGPN